MFDLSRAIEQAWPVLVEAARSGQTISYTELAGRAGAPLHRRHVHRQLLKPLSARCRLAGLPDLSALVVRKDSGLPGGGWFDPTNPSQPLAAWAEALAACYAYPWPRRPDLRLLNPDGRAPARPKPPKKRPGKRRNLFAMNHLRNSRLKLAQAPELLDNPPNPPSRGTVLRKSHSYKQIVSRSLCERV